MEPLTEEASDWTTRKQAAAIATVTIEIAACHGLRNRPRSPSQTVCGM